VKAPQICFAALLLAGPIFGSGHAEAADRHHGNRGQDQGQNGERSASLSIEFSVSDRDAIRDYYRERPSANHCPPGLAKKNNGCLPPGQAKKWAKGRPLPRDVVYHDLPGDLSIRLNAPVGHRYVRIASDIVLLAMGTGMVLDAIEDLGRL
jgi:hypothetical protein